MTAQADVFTFEVVPVADGFVPFLLDVPTLLGLEAAARRAYFSVMALLASQGLDVEDFEVYEWVGSDARGRRGRGVCSGGIRCTT